MQIVPGTKLKKTTKDREVFKIVEKVSDTEFLSPFTKTQYTTGEEVNAELVLNQAGDKVKRGIFAIAERRTAQKFLNPKHRFYDAGKIAISCIIPAGINYYYNSETKEIMAEKMVIGQEVSVKRTSKGNV